MSVGVALLDADSREVLSLSCDLQHGLELTFANDALNSACIRTGFVRCIFTHCQSYHLMKHVGFLKFLSFK